MKGNVSKAKGGIEPGAVGIIVDSALSPTSKNPVQNKVVKGAIDELNQSISNLGDSVSDLNDEFKQSSNFKDSLDNYGYVDVPYQFVNKWYKEATGEIIETPDANKSVFEELVDIYDDMLLRFTNTSGAIACILLYDFEKEYVGKIYDTSDTAADLQKFHNARYFRVAVEVSHDSANSNIHITLVKKEASFATKDALAIKSDSVYDLFERTGDNQIFDYRTLAFTAQPLFENGITQKLSFNSLCAFVYLEINGTPGEKYSYYYLPQTAAEYAYVSDIRIAAFNDIPTVDVGFIPGTKKTDYKGEIELSDNYKYLGISFRFARPTGHRGIEDRYMVQQAIYTVFPRFVLRKGAYEADYNTYYDYYQKPEGTYTTDIAVRYRPEKTCHVGNNLINSVTPVSLGNGWSGDFENGFTKIAGTTETLEIGLSTDIGDAYIIDFDYSGSDSSLLELTIGNEPKVDVYNGTRHCTIGIVSDGGHVKFIPANTFADTLNNICLRKVIPSAQPGTDITISSKNVNSSDNGLTGFWNVAIGAENTQSENQNGSRNIAIGYAAQNRLKSGTRNIAIGTFAMPYVTEGDRNVAIGADTLYKVGGSGTTKACDNVAIGKATMSSGTDVERNVAIGSQAMAHNVDEAENNVAIGYQAGYYSKRNNTSIGYRAGYYPKGEGNTSVGASAGTVPYVTGDNNVCIGNNANFNPPGAASDNIVTLENSIVIGSNAKASKSNQVILGTAAHEEVFIAGKKIIFGQDGSVTWEAL